LKNRGLTSQSPDLHVKTKSIKVQKGLGYKLNSIWRFLVKRKNNSGREKEYVVRLLDKKRELHNLQSARLGISKKNKLKK